jgi:flavin reductase (DIM6/NTAB) family NADH-FMN oxidoreductase RutF
MAAADGHMVPVSPDDFRRAAGHFASGIVVVSTRADAVDHAMTVTAFTAVSLEPLLVLFCAEKVARFHDAVLAAGTWAVSVLNEDAEKTARWLATRGRPLEGQLDAFRHHRGPLTAAPILDDALAAMECRTIVVGEVLAVTEPSPDGGPLLYYSRNYRRLGDG